MSRVLFHGVGSGGAAASVSCLLHFQLLLPVCGVEDRGGAWKLLTLGMVVLVALDALAVPPTPRDMGAVGVLTQRGMKATRATHL